MDLNLIVYDENEFCNEKLIYNKINRSFKEGFKTIALSTIINGNNIANMPAPIQIKFQSTDVKILNRLTVKVGETMQFYQLSKNENLKYYDLLAIDPLNEKVLNYINNGNFDCDLISLTTNDSKIVNFIKKTNFSIPISKGIGIEINYADCLSSSSQRRQTIACGQMLVDKSNAKNIIISSGTKSLINSKSPIDVIYIGLLFGLNEFQSKKAIFQNGLHVIKHSGKYKKKVKFTIIIIIILHSLCRIEKKYYFKCY